MILKIKNISFSYKSNKVLENVNFEVNKGEITAILGKNGAGKSTLLKTIAKMIKPISGSVYLSKENLHKMLKKEFVKRLSYVSQKQNPNELNVFEMLLLGRRPYFKYKPSNEDYKIVDNIIQKLGIEEYKLKSTYELSGGELQKVAIARALVQDSEVILLDEPTNNLDLKNQIEIK